MMATKTLYVATSLLFLLGLFDVIHVIAFLDIDELNSVHYGIEILKEPILLPKETLSTSVHLMSKFGQQYQCNYPDHSEHDKLIEEVEKVAMEAGIPELLRPLGSRPCLFKTKDWWSYEFCYGKYIRQYHMEDNKPAGEIIYLGHFESEYNWENNTKHEINLRNKHLQNRYHSQRYMNGTKCDLSGTSRKTEVRFMCEEGNTDYIGRIDESETCVYMLTVYTSAICHHPYMKPPTPNRPVPIVCNPVLAEDQYNAYLEHMQNEEKLKKEKENEEKMQEETLKVAALEKDLPVVTEKEDSTNTKDSETDTEDIVKETALLEEKMASDLEKDHEEYLEKIANLPVVTEKEDSTNTKDSETDTEDIVKESALLEEKIASDLENRVLEYFAKTTRDTLARIRHNVDTKIKIIEKPEDATAVLKEMPLSSKTSPFPSSSSSSSSPEKSASQDSTTTEDKSTLAENVLPGTETKLSFLDKENDNKIDDDDDDDNNEEEESENLDSSQLTSTPRSTETITSTTSTLSDKNEEKKSKDESETEEDLTIFLNKEIELVLKMQEKLQGIIKSNSKAEKEFNDIEQEQHGNRIAASTYKAYSLLYKMEHIEKQLRRMNERVREDHKILLKFYSTMEHPSSADSSSNKDTLKSAPTDSADPAETQHPTLDPPTKDPDTRIKVRLTKIRHVPPTTDKKEFSNQEEQKLEQSVKEGLEKAGLDSVGDKIQVRIITAGYYDSDDDSLKVLSEEDATAFKNMFIAMLGSHDESTKELERHKQLEENYSFVWKDEKKQMKEESQK